MNIMIAGAGTVGYSLAQSLSYKHNIFVIDKDITKLNKLEEDIDILTLHGDIEDPKIYQALAIKEADLFIAVTDSDEANLLATLIVEDVVEIKKKIIRLKNDGFLKSHVLQKLSIDHAVFPDITTAKKVKTLMSFPKANNVKMFHQTKLKLVSLRVQHETPEEMTAGMLSGRKVSVVGIERGKTLLIPGADDRIFENDLVYLFGEMEEIKILSQKLDEKMPASIRRIVIFGANTLAQKIAKALVDDKTEIKMIEKCLDHCKRASEVLEGRVTIINSAYEDQRLFEEEGLKNADMIIAAGSHDEQNIVKCMEAKEYGIEKVVAINNDKAYYHLMHKMGIVVVRGSKASAHYAILEKVSSDSIVTQRHFCGGSGILFMRKVYSNSALIGKAPKSVRHAQAKVLLIREEQVYGIGEVETLAQDDIVAVFAHIDEKEKIEEWIHTL